MCEGVAPGVWLDTSHARNQVRPPAPPLDRSSRDLAPDSGQLCHDPRMAKPWWKAELPIGDGWVLGDPLGPGLDHVRAVAHPDGRRGVAKGIRGGQRGVGRSRLENEITAMRDLAGEEGVLPLLDSSTDERAFMITPKAQLLAESLGPEPNLREVVAAFADLANTLAKLHARGIFHRDLKPANLFWLEDRAVLGDFGLVAGATQEDAALTAADDIIGSIYFLAPEATEPSTVSDWGQCDVYSLAMCLWTIAREKRFPAASTLRGDDLAFSLYPVGGPPADDLVALLEAATMRRAFDRPRMGLFARELAIWLDLHPATTRPAKQAAGRIEFPAIYEMRAHADGIEGEAKRSLSQLSRSVINHLPPSMSSVDNHEEPGAILDAPDIASGDPDFEPTWGPITAIRQFTNHPNLRLVLELVGVDTRRGVYLAEWQVRKSSSWQVHWSEQRALATFVRFPSDHELRTYDLARTIAKNTPQSETE